MEKVKSTTKLSKLKAGQTGKVTMLNFDDFEFKQRLMDMGITRGVEIQIKKNAPFGDPVSLCLRGYRLCLRRKDLENIEVEVI